MLTAPPQERSSLPLQRCLFDACNGQLATFGCLDDGLRDSQKKNRLY